MHKVRITKSMMFHRKRADRRAGQRQLVAAMVTLPLLAVSDNAHTVGLKKYLRTPASDGGVFNAEPFSRQLDSGVCFDNRCQDDLLYRSDLGLSCDDIYGFMDTAENCFVHWLEPGGQEKTNKVLSYVVLEKEFFHMIEACPCACNLDCGKTHAPTTSPVAPSTSPSSSPGESQTSRPSASPTSHESSKPSAVPTSKIPTILPKAKPLSPIKLLEDLMFRSGSADISSNQINGLEKASESSTDDEKGGIPTTVLVVIGIVTAVSAILYATVLRMRVKKCFEDKDSSTTASNADRYIIPNGKRVAAASVPTIRPAPVSQPTPAKSAFKSYFSLPLNGESKPSPNVQRVKFADNPVTLTINPSLSLEDGSYQTDVEMATSYSDSSYSASFDGDSLNTEDETDDFIQYMRWKKEMARKGSDKRSLKRDVGSAKHEERAKTERSTDGFFNLSEWFPQEYNGK